MLSFRTHDMDSLSGPYSSWYDKSHLLKGKNIRLGLKKDHIKAGFRMVPNSPVRKGSFIGKNAVLMPCFVNIGAYVDEGNYGGHLGFCRILRTNRKELSYIWWCWNWGAY